MVGQVTVKCSVCGTDEAGEKHTHHYIGLKRTAPELVFRKLMLWIGSTFIRYIIGMKLHTYRSMHKNHVC